MQRQRISSTADTLTTLPDEILCRILSFLTTKQAVATTVLSKRWIHLCHSVLNLIFTDITINTVESNFRFNESVYSVLASRDAVASNLVDNFHLDIRYGNSHLAYNLGFPNITKWINVIVKRKLKFLYLHIRVPLPDHFVGFPYLPKLPVSILTCRTLVSLDLRWFRVKGFSFSESDGFEFPSLKTLHLRFVKFLELRDFMLLLAGCPILEDLQCAHVYFYWEEDSVTVQEFKRLSLPKLIRADLNQCWCSCYMAKAFSTSVSLCIETSTLYAKDYRVYKANKLKRPNIPMFHNLTNLTLHNNLDLVVEVLHRCPKLQNLQLYQGLYEAISNPEDDQENWVEPQFVPQCLSSYLRTCTIRHFSGPKFKLMLAKYILKNAKLLQTMTIWTKSEMPEIERELSPYTKKPLQHVNFQFLNTI